MDLSQLKPGLAGTASTTVDAAQTARALGSGGEEVFGTPALAALMERAAVACVERLLPVGRISLGTHLAIDHVAPSPVGATVSARAELIAHDGRSLQFSITAHQGDLEIGRAMHRRAVVDRERFLANLAQNR